MNNNTAQQVVALAELLLSNRPGGNPQTLNVGGKIVTVNPITSAAEAGYELTWDSDDHEPLTARFVINLPYATITRWD